MTATDPLHALPVEHEHDLHLVMVDYDETCMAVREYEYTSCGTVWFE